MIRRGTHDWWEHTGTCGICKQECTSSIPDHEGKQIVHRECADRKHVLKYTHCDWCAGVIYGAVARVYGEDDKQYHNACYGAMMAQDKAPRMMRPYPWDQETSLKEQKDGLTPEGRKAFNELRDQVAWNDICKMCGTACTWSHSKSVWICPKCRAVSQGSAKCTWCTYSFDAGDKRERTPEGFMHKSCASLYRRLEARG